MARDPYKYFRIEARDLIDQLGNAILALERDGRADTVKQLLRLTHTLKGAARVVRLADVADQAHAMEDLLAPHRDAADALPVDVVSGLLSRLDQVSTAVGALSQPVPVQAPAAGPAPEEPVPAAPAPAEEPNWILGADAVDVDRLLDGLGQIGEQLERLSMLSRLTIRTSPTSGELSSLASGLDDVHRRIDREVDTLRQGVEELRLVPARALFATCARAVRDSALALGKQARFLGEGGDVRVDAETMRVVQDALQQLVRNAVAHGIEPPAQRIAAGKPEAGRITVSVQQRGSTVLFRCGDDGAGIDRRALQDAFARRGRAGADFTQLDDAGLARLLLQGGVSTSAAVSEVAGRGIGMDIVRHAVTELGATFTLTTTRGRGTTFELAVPQTIGHVAALAVEAGGSTVGIPLAAVRRTVRVNAADIQHLASGDTVVDADAALPLRSLSRLLGGSSLVSGIIPVVIVATGEAEMAVAVDRIVGVSDMVFRPLPELAPAISAIAGAALRADGAPILILEPHELVDGASVDRAPPPAPLVRRRPLLVIDDSLTTRMLEQSILESAGYEVDLAVSGEEGLARARSGDYGLILVDVEMPGMDGFSFIEQIRADARLRDTPAIMVTSRNAPEDRQRGLAAGAQDYVVKSEFDQAALLARIKELMA